MSGEAFELGASGPVFSMPDKVTAWLADELESVTDDGGPTIAEYLRRFGCHDLATEHAKLIAALRRMSEVYGAIQWHAAGDTSVEQMYATLNEISARTP